MSKYQPLAARLAGHVGPEWRVGFTELEKVLGFPLPKGARAGRTWWKQSASHSRAWTEAGWEVAEVDPVRGSVAFRKVGDALSRAPIVAPSPGGSDEPAILRRLEASPKWSAVALVAGGVALAAGLGALAVRGVMRRKA